MDELVERVAVALTAEYSGAPNGRVRDLPDRRAIRWYTTTGLVDRPLGMRGRTALYGRRHLLQLVAVKRRQAQGHTLAAIQAELQGASDAVLADVARVPEEAFAGGSPPAESDAVPARPRFWATAPAAPGLQTARDKTSRDNGAQDESGRDNGGQDEAAQDRGTQDQTARDNGTQDDDARDRGPRRSGAQWKVAQVTTAREEAAHDEAAETTPLLGALTLGGGAILVLPGQPDPADRAAIAAAAEPLLALLADRGLLKFDDGSPS